MVTYLRDFLDFETSNRYLDQFKKEIEWKRDELWIFGKQRIARRQVAWYGDKPFHYRYSGTVKIALPWIDDLRTLRNLIQELDQQTYNSCLLNYYPDGSAGMGWHADNEPELKPGGTIVTLSLGAPRRISFRHNLHKTKVDILLEPGSLLFMRGETQHYWQHAIPYSRKIKEGRISLTFRNIIDQIFIE